MTSARTCPYRARVITRRGIRAALAALVAATALPAAAAAAGPVWVPGEVLVGTSDGRAVGGRPVGAPGAGIRLVETRPGETVPEAVARLRAKPGVAWAEPNRIVTTAAVPNDPFAGEEYWFHNTGQVNGGRVAGVPDADVDVPEAWAITRGSPAVTVAVVDGGVAYDSPDLASAIWTNPGETGGGRESNGVDDDHNGLVDDWRGWDWRDDDNDPRDLGLFPHGTAVAGIIGARADDGYGVAGVAPLTRIMALRINSPSGAASISDVVAAFGYAQRMGARVVNASFGGTTASSAERAAITAAPGVLFVTSAGNDGRDMDAGGPNYPCAFDLPNVICVAATDERDLLAGFSNRGATTVDLAAPGVGVLTTAPPYAELATEDFETPLEGRWVTGGTGGTWQRTTERAASGAWSVADSPGGPYGNDVSHWLQRVAPVNLTNRVGCRIDIQYRSQTVNPDGLYFETSTNGGSSWSPAGHPHRRHRRLHRRRRRHHVRAGAPVGPLPPAHELEQLGHRRRLRRGRPGPAVPGRHAGRARPDLRERHLLLRADRLGDRGAAAGPAAVAGRRRAARRHPRRGRPPAVARGQRRHRRARQRPQGPRGDRGRAAGDRDGDRDRPRPGDAPVGPARPHRRGDARPPRSPAGRPAPPASSSAGRRSSGASPRRAPGPSRWAWAVWPRAPTA